MADHRRQVLAADLLQDAGDRRRRVLGVHVGEEETGLAVDGAAGE
jgi:hypothetical protein